jgi:molybdopterin-guanine dinucleotide biosynthesis protein A
MVKDSLTLVIQAGGESRRMGQDKALLPFLGEPLILRVLRRLQPIADEVIVVARQPENLAFLGVRVVSDLLPGIGALGGLYTALAVARSPLVGVVACDMPFVSAGLLNEARSRLVQTGMDAVIPRTAQGWEPLHAVYRRETCLLPVERAIQRGERRLIAWHAEARVLALSGEDILPFDPHLRAFLNINTPEDLRLAEALAREEEPDGAEALSEG